MLDRPCNVAAAPVQQAQVVMRPGDAGRAAQPCVQRPGAVVVRHGAGMVTAGAGDPRKRAVERAGAVVEALDDPQGAVEQLLGPVELTPGDGQRGGDLQRAGERGTRWPVRSGVGERERPIQRRLPLTDVTAGVEAPAQDRGKRQRLIGPAVVRGVLEGRVQVALSGPDIPHRQRLLAGADQPFHPHRVRRVVAGVLGADRLGLTVVVELLGGELANALQQPELGNCAGGVRRRTRLLSTSEAVVSTTSAAPQTCSAASSVHPPTNTDSRRNSTRSSGPRRSWLHVSAARNVRCRSGPSRAPLVNSRIRCRRRNVSSPAVNSLRRAVASSRASEPVETDADLGERGSVGGGDREVGLEPAHPVQQHRDRRRLGEPFQVVDVAGRGQLQRGHRVLPLAAQVQPLPAGGKQSQQRTLREERSERRTRVENVLHVVHDDQEVSLRHGGEDPSGSGRPGGSRRPSARATSGSTRSGSRTGVRSTNTTPSRNSDAAAAAAAIARRVFPTPGGPVSVISRSSALVIAAPSAASSASRPISGVAEAGRPRCAGVVVAASRNLHIATPNHDPDVANAARTDHVARPSRGRDPSGDRIQQD